MASGKLRRTLDGFSRGVGLALPSAQTAAAWPRTPAERSNSGTPRDGQLLSAIDSGRNKLYPGFESVAFSPDRVRLAASQRENNNSIDIWDVASGALLNRLDGHSLTISSVAFSPDGAWLASGSDDNTINLWEVVSEKITDLSLSRRHSKIVNIVAFSPDGTQLAAGAD